MKCPKCGYLGFDTGDRCRNCGYDFSLMAAPIAAPELDLNIRTDDAGTKASEPWLDRLDRSMDEVSTPNPQDDHLIGVQPPAAPPADPPAEQSLPLFNPEDPDDIPLIALPAAPRPPLAVRRAPDTPRLRAVPRASRATEPVPALNFLPETSADEPADDGDAPPAPEPARRAAAASAAPPAPPVGARRVGAALIDHAILGGIDLGVLYFTLRIAGLELGDIRLLPLAPFAAFLTLLKLSYFSAFTAIGGQTIGKMTLGVRVVADRGSMDGALAVRRTLAAVLSLLPLGLGYLPALVGGDRRTLHDRLTGTRVVERSSA